MQTRRIFLIMAAVTLLQVQAKAQAVNDTARLFAEMKRLQSVYQAHELSFDIKYTYTSEQQPELVLDSLQGKMELSGKRYHYWMTNMETMVNERYNITLFRQEKMIYLTKPATFLTGDPVAQLRDMLERAGVKQCNVVEQGDLKTLRIYFQPGGACRQMEMIIDKTSGYITATRYIVKTALLMEPGVSPTDAGYGEYAVIKTSFDHYKQIKIDSSRFNEDQFFHKEGNEFKTTPAYNEYKIFTGSPNL